MTDIMLIFYPAKEAYVGIYWPASGKWHTQPLAETAASYNRYLTAITQLLADHHVHLQDITHIGVFTGPATYTELRSGVTTANTLAWARDLPIFALDDTATLPQDISHAALTAERNRTLAPKYPSPLV